MNIFRFIILLLIVSSINCFAFSGKGDGTVSNPYQIENLDQLQEIKDDLAAHYILMNDIDASASKTWNIGNHDGNSSTPDSAKGFEPIGKYFKKFTGSLDGKNYSIDNLYINRPKYDNVGIFAFADVGNANMKNIRVRDCFVCGGENVGALAATINGKVENIIVTGKICGLKSVGGIAGVTETLDINNSSVEATIIAEENVGGFVGLFLSGEINNSDAEVLIEGSYMVGGIVGKFESGSISQLNVQAVIIGGGLVGGILGGCDRIYIDDSSINGDIKGEYHVGGVVGYGNADLNNVHSSGKILASDSEVGGLVGYSDGMIVNCSSSMDVEGYANAGGLAGISFNTISNSFATGNVSGRGPSGGLVGGNNDTIRNCHAEGTVTGNGCAGGLAGDTDRPIIDSYATGDVVGGDYAGGLIGKTLKRINDDEVGVANCFAKGDVSGITHVGGLIGSGGGILSNCYSEGNIKSESKDNNLDTYIGGLCGFFTGEMEKCYSAGNILVNNTGLVIYIGGLIGKAYISEIKCSYSLGNIQLIKEDGGLYESSMIGGFAGKTESSNIDKCYYIGSIDCNTNSSHTNVGGFTALLSERGSIQNSFAIGDVSGTAFVGGFIANIARADSVKNCFSVGKISSASATTGGFVVTNKGGHISDIWKLATITNCFWDIDVSQKYFSEGGTGVPTHQLKTKSFLTFSKWDFNEVWEIDPVINYGYPYLNCTGIPTSVEGGNVENSNEAIIYPNPVSSFLYVQLTNDNTVKYYLLNILGELVKAGNLDRSDHIIDIRDIPSGIYFIRFEDKSYKIIKI